MFADWELIGVPVRITVGERSLKEGKLELLRRTGMVSSICDRDQVGAAVKTLLAATA
jgi:prolyl-tRNA synthetase